VHRNRERLRGRESWLERAVDQKAPDVLERDAADEIVDVDTAVTQGAAFLVRLGDLRLERDDALETVLNVGHASSLGLLVAPHCANRHGWVVDGHSWPVNDPFCRVAVGVQQLLLQ
jgi:hypothetical protein